MKIDLTEQYESGLKKILSDHKIRPVFEDASEKIMRRFSTSSNVTNKDNNLASNLIDDFIGLYSSIATESHNHDIFEKEHNNDYFELIRVYSTYTSSKAIINKMIDEDINQLRLESNARLSYLSPSDIKPESDFTMIRSLLRKMDGVGTASTIEVTKFQYFKFFQSVNVLTLQYLKSHKMSEQTRDKLEQTSFYIGNFDFSTLAEPKKSDFKHKLSRGPKEHENDLEKLPTELNRYLIKPYASLDNMVVNQEITDALIANICRLSSYDPETGINPFMNGEAIFKPLIVLHGVPGTGKNFNLDAVLNYFLSTSSQYGESYEVVDLSAKAMSMYKDRSAMIFERYLDLENDPNKLYINVIDEADAIIGMSENSEADKSAKEIQMILKKRIANGFDGNKLYFAMTNYADKLEAALNDRAILMHVRGPTEPEHFEKALRIHLGNIGDNITDKEYFAIGKNLYELKKIYKNDFSLNYRFVESLAGKFTGGIDNLFVNNLNEFRKLPKGPERLVYIRAMQEKPTYDSIMGMLDLVIKESIEAKAGTTTHMNSG